MTYADTLRPTVRRSALLYDLSLILGGSLVIALLAQVAIPLPFTPVPITGQTFGILLIGALLGSWRGAVTVLAYLIEGVSGLPVFAGATAGPVVLAGPTGGYLLGFVVAAFLVGLLAEQRWDRTLLTSSIMMTLGTITIFAFGLLWLLNFMPMNQVLLTGLYPFVPGAFLKIVLATLLLPVGWKFLGKSDQ